MKLQMFNSHPAACFGGKYYVVDTGSPVSFSFDGANTLNIDGREFRFGSPVCKKEALDGLTGADMTGLIGMNVIAKTGLTLDPENGLLAFSANALKDSPAAVLSFDLFMGYYIVTNDVRLGAPLNNAIIDTGAPIPYVSARILAALEPTGESYEDFSPSFGALKGEYRKGALSFTGSGSARPVKVGAMPQLLDMFGIFDAILGVTSLTDKAIVFDFERKEIRLRS